MYDEEQEVAKAVEQVNRAKALGVKTICDPTVMEQGRDIRFIERIARETDTQIVAATGIYTYNYIPTLGVLKGNDSIVRRYYTGYRHCINYISSYG